MINVILNADDFGINNDVNSAIVQCFKDGLISNTTIMTNMPNSSDAVILAKENGFFDSVGLHLNLREGQPMTRGILSDKVFCSNGVFQMNINSMKKYFFSSKFLGKNEKEHLIEEIEAQFRWYVSAGFPEMHIDSHQSVHTWYMFLSAINLVFKKYKFRTMRKRVTVFDESLIKRKYRYFINNRIQNPISAMYDISSFVNSYSIIKDDYCEVMCHPIMKDGTPVDSLSGLPIETIKKMDGVHLISYNEVKKLKI